MIEGIVGLPGSGKTYYISKLGLEAIKKGRKVYSNYKLKGAINYTELTELINVEKALILIDEINIICPSRKWDLLPTDLLYWWSQTRKLELDIVWTAQHQDRVDKAVKEVSAFIWKINSLPFGFRIMIKFLPEQIGKVKRESFGRKIFHINKEVFSQYNTYERINPASYIQEKKPYWKNNYYRKPYYNNYKRFDTQQAIRSQQQNQIENMKKQAELKI